MTLAPNQKLGLLITVLLIWTLACRAATRLIIPDTPTPQATPTLILTATLVPTLTPSLTPTLVAYEASCPLVVSQIMKDSISTDPFVHGNEEFSEEDVTYMAHYTVVGDELKTPLFYPVREDLEDEQEDRVSHEKIWDLYTHIIPAEQRSLLKGFVIFTDGREKYLASVNKAKNDRYKWDLNVDILDSTQKTSLTYTLLHEQGHLLTLNKDQVEALERIDACPQYFTGKGCSMPDSYINVFFERFWQDLYAEWLEIDKIENEQSRENKLNLFYDIYQDQFLTDYAPTSPMEDIAESFTFFILEPKPELTSIASEKILFFYEYPELIELRTQILENICGEFKQ